MGGSLPVTALQLMRSRYSAYALAKIDYIQETMCPPASKGFDPIAAHAWASRVHWLGLTILSFSETEVRFAARYEDKGKLKLMCEASTFKQIDGRWYYVSGQPIKPTANGPCPCGSGKKFKRCCGAS